jgi:Ca-activated chloride channel family protein
MNHLKQIVLLIALPCVVTISLRAQSGQNKQNQGFEFRTAVDLVSVTATVTDRSGRFVAGLRAEDFEVYEDGKRQTVTQFDAARVPVSLGIALDTSGSMLGEKMTAARSAISRFVYDLLGADDEMFLYRFDGRPVLVQDWTEDRAALMRGLGNVRPNGGTAMYDAVAEAVPLAATGERSKKALVVISDGNDTSSHTRLPEVQQVIRESEVLVYAIGIDGPGGGYRSGRGGVQVPLPIPGGPTIQLPFPRRPPASQPGPRSPRMGPDERVNATALQSLTDDSGGRTEIIDSSQDLGPATARIADELSRQYLLAYVSNLPKDGRWHAIEVRVKRSDAHVRARRGYIAD